jgi:hypothetical protein
MTHPKLSIERNIMRTVTCLLLLALAPVVSRAQNQPQGDLIGGTPGTNAKPATVSLSQTNGQAGAVGVAAVPKGALFGFDRLAGYPITMPDELTCNTNRPAWADAQVNALIPAAIRAADGKTVTVEGFMMPVTFGEKGKVTSFLLTMNQPSCCYGGASQIHEFVVVRAPGPGVGCFMDGPVRVQGTLHVGAEREGGVLSSVYRLDEDEGSPPKPQY